MGAYELDEDDAGPVGVAHQHGLCVVQRDDIPWTVASNGFTVYVSDHPDERVIAARIWEGIAQALLIRRGEPWHEDDALRLAAELKRHDGGRRIH